MALIGVVVGGLFGTRNEISAVPNQGIHQSAWNAIVIGLVFGLVFGLIFWPLLGPLFGLVTCLLVGLRSGGSSCLKHLVLRLMLVRSGTAPWNYVAFLDHAADRILLRKVGGGYVFIHRMLLEYF